MKDIVCGMEVSADSEYHYQHAGEHFHFCSEHCLQISEQREHKFRK
jgi:Cu+-exporting ATPase